MSRESGKRIRALKAKAIAAGNKHYESGLPCRLGHIAPREAKNGLCVECTKIRYTRNRPSRRRQERKRDGLPEPTRPEPPGCEICGGKTARKLEISLNVDHSHQTGKFRGWLCGNCNRGLGLLGDTLQSILKVAAYLERYDVS